MSHRPLTLKQWQNFSQQITTSKQTVEQLSKLYIIIHQKVKSTIKNSVTNPTVDFSQQIHHHVEFIKNVLEKISNSHTDQYLVGVEKQLLRKYQQQMLSLLEQIETMLKVEESKIDLNVEKLRSIKQEKRQQHDLKSEVQQSIKRIVRAKSGYKIKTAHNQTPQIPAKNKMTSLKELQTTSNSFFPTTISYQTKSTLAQINTQHQLQSAFQAKRQKLSSKMEKSMSPRKNGLGLSFRKKYQENYLQMYFNERKQFADLMFNQQAYDKIIQYQNFQTTKTESKTLDSQIFSLKGIKIQQINTKLFPQFQIKTKFLKPQVKSKISSLITEIKKELMNQYFVSNIQALKAVNQEQKVKESPRKKSSMPSLHKKNHSLSNIKKGKQSQTTLQTKEQSTRLGKTNFTASPEQQSPTKMRKTNSFSELYKGQMRSTRIKKSFINFSSKPFYQTEKWNTQVEKKFQNKLMSKLVKAKLP